ncbi:MAG TPA: hypothetical protein VFE82_08840 [Ramlibacter sp.]|uniref:hypothetical protein n=1 Tax=Ramlibacter sp. TaxID=1917967 RepID=UPI002D3A32D4|nr:hypothetical protein [Ramlibacter sp.]HZY18576.1 hypothetical protein [Ramlibacter sp.]
MIPADLAAAVAALEPLQQAQYQAVRDGDADTLASLAAAMRPSLAVLARHAGQGELPAALRPRLATLAAQAGAARTVATRRSLDVQRSLEALGRLHGGLQEHQQRGTYGAGGGFAASAWRSGACEQA